MKALAKSQRWSEAELARRSGLDPSAIHRLLNGQMQVGRDSIAGLLWAFLGPFEGRVVFDDLFILDGRGMPVGAALPPSGPVAVDDPEDVEQAS